MSESDLIASAVSALEAELAATRDALRPYDALLAKEQRLLRALTALRGEARATQRHETTAEAVSRVLRAASAPQSVPEILRALLASGWRTSSPNGREIIRSALRQRPDLFLKTGFLYQLRDSEANPA